MRQCFSQRYNSQPNLMLLALCPECGGQVSAFECTRDAFVLVAMEAPGKYAVIAASIVYDVAMDGDGIVEAS